MDKKYQIFVSSTFADLKEERMAVTHAILDIEHIPAGMEMFPAADIQQMDYIERVIDECDYYVLIIAGRYGEVDASGISYTHQEYNYAKSVGKPVLAFLRKDADQIPVGKTDQDKNKAKALKNFIGEVKSGRLVQWWTSIDELNSKTIVALTKAFRLSPQTGWVRADKLGSEASASELLEYRKKIDVLEKQVSNVNPDSYSFNDIAGLNYKAEIYYSFAEDEWSDATSSDTISVKYADIIEAIAPALFSPATISEIKDAIKNAIPTNFGGHYAQWVKNDYVNKMIATFIVMGLVQLNRDSKIPTYKLTEAGMSAWLASSYARNEASEAKLIEAT